MVIVSFPRSGQNLLESIFRNLSKSIGIGYSYCEFYSCCRSIPCKNGCLLSKNHDFDGYLKIDNSIKYISIYRGDFILQLESYYRFIIKNNGREYSYDDLLLFCEQNYPYYKRFVNKWIKNENDNILKIEYYQFVSNPDIYIKRCFNHFFPDIILDDDLFNNISEKIFDVYSGDPKENLIHNKISLLNTISPELYDKMKVDLFHLTNLS